MFTKKNIIIATIICMLASIMWITSAQINDIIETHFQYSSKKINYMNKTRNGESNDLRFIFSEADEFWSRDIVRMLDSSSNKEQTLNEYLIDWENLLASIKYKKNELNSEIQQINNRMKNCQTDLTNANQSFNTSLKSRNENWFYDAVEKAKKARACLWEEQVNNNVTKTVLNMLEKYEIPTEKRVTYLRNNQSLIVKHYEILKPKLLSELYSIAVQLDRSK